MSTHQPDKSLLEALPDVTPDMLRYARQQWSPHNTMRRVITFLARQKVEAARNALETCSPEDLPKLQAKIEATRELIGAINSEFKP